MTDVAKALKRFYSSFGLPAYTEDDVPDDTDVQPPYITYTAVQSDVFSGATHQARVWYPGTRNTEANAKAGEIIKRVGRGVKLRAGRGYVCIYPGDPLAQKQPGDDVRIIYLNLELRAYV